MPLTRAEALVWLRHLRDLPSETRRAAIAALPQPAFRAILEEWWWQAHTKQREPEGDWRIWAIVAGRGFGKTRAGAEWVWARARAEPEARIALVAASREEAARVMIEGESGLLATARCDEAPRWISSRGLLLFPSGAAAYTYSAGQPGQLRGPQHHHAWCDELAKWARAEAAWDNLMLGLRLGQSPRALVTTTPRPVPLLDRILKLRRCHATRGATWDNPGLAEDYVQAAIENYHGTRLARQELEGLILGDLPGALWTREMIEGARGAPFVIASKAKQSSADIDREAGLSRYAHNDEAGDVSARSPRMERIVIGLDPPASANGDACGLVVCGVDGEGVAWVLADLTASGLSPEGWARRVAAAAQDWDAQLIVAEKNQGGDMIASVLAGVDAGLPVRLVAATRAKAARAEPVALRFETGRARLAGGFPALEDQMCATTYRGYEGEGSPDRLDAMVWAMSELIRPRGDPRVRGF